MTTVQVEQSDRDAAAELCDAISRHLSAALIRQGRGDDDPVTVVIATTRITAAAEARERAAKVAEGMWTGAEEPMMCVAAFNLAGILRNLSPTPTDLPSVEDTRYTGAEVDRSGYADADLPLPDFTRACTTPGDDAAREALARWIDGVQIADGATAGEFQDVLVGMVRGGGIK